jgi:hypothetical protein
LSNIFRRYAPLPFTFELSTLYAMESRNSDELTKDFLRDRHSLSDKYFGLARERAHMWTMSLFHRINPNVAKVRYCEPSPTQEMRYHRLSRRVNNMAVFSPFLDITAGGFVDEAL